MGFNLKMFFQELELILDSKINWFTKLGRLRKYILEAKQYAEECGYLR